MAPRSRLQKSRGVLPTAIRSLAREVLIPNHAFAKIAANIYKQKK